jgi:hypothetical protein
MQSLTGLLKLIGKRSHMLTVYTDDKLFFQEKAKVNTKVATGQSWAPLLSLCIVFAILLFISYGFSVRDKKNKEMGIIVPIGLVASFI